MLLSVNVGTGSVLFPLNSRPLLWSKHAVGLGPGFIMPDVRLFSFQPLDFMPRQFSTSNTLINSLSLVSLPLN